MKRFKTLALVAGLGLASVALAQLEPPTRIRGTITAHTADTLTVQQRSGGTVTIALKSNVPIASVRRIALEDIRQGSFIGTAARRGPDGKLIAQEVVVFPESQRGTGEGHYAWDLGAHSTMTNANVDAVVESTEGRVLHLSYSGGQNTVTVPPNVPIVTFIPATVPDLVAGKKVFVIASVDADRHLVAQRLVVEKDGVVPPM
jgi:hypothetical protein